MPRLSWLYLAALIPALLMGTGCGGAATGSSHSQSLAVQGQDNSSSSNAPGPSQGQQSDAGSAGGQNAQSTLPTPPANAVTYAHIEQMGNWGSCNTLDCSGGSGNGEFWMAQNQSTPSLGGRSMELHNSGTWSDALWWNKFGAQDSASNFLWDFYFRIEEAAGSAAQALEFDVFQFRDGYNYMMGTQCNYASGAWELWDETNGKWMQSKAACPKFTPGTWHHVQWYTQRVQGAAQYTFVTLVVDGVSYSINQTYSAKNVGWNRIIGVQYQMDVNATGAGYEMWVDQSTLTAW